MYPIDLSATRPLPQPPRLHWGWVLALNIITLGIFEGVWLIVQANWVRKVRGKSRTMPWAIILAALLPGFFLFIFILGVVFAIAQISLDQSLVGILTNCFRIALVIVRLTTIYTLRNELAEEPINIQTGGVMTLFFGGIYFQYHLQDFTFDGANRSAADGTLGLSLR
jgi:amino acid transporter